MPLYKWSAAQKKQFKSMQARRHNKENISPIPSPPTPKKAISRLPDYRKKYRNEQCKNLQLAAKNIGLTSELGNAHDQLKIACKNALTSSKHAEAAKTEILRQHTVIKGERTSHQSKMSTLQLAIRALKAKLHRAPAMTQRAIQKARRTPLTVKLTKQGTYTPEAHALI
ncbi:hypothetical protein DXG01_003618 [Tephrocybe rancida]|nr:hypothetical protein DXG01_003618 [Tephrocybe rancida]